MFQTKKPKECALCGIELQRKESEESWNWDFDEVTGLYTCGIHNGSVKMKQKPGITYIAIKVKGQLSMQENARLISFISRYGLAGDDGFELHYEYPQQEAK